MTDALTNCWGNPSALYQFGMEADHRLRQARKSVAAALGAEEDRVFFTSGGTEADNWAIFGAVERLRKRGRHIVTTAVEHHAVAPSHGKSSRPRALRSPFSSPAPTARFPWRPSPPPCGPTPFWPA